MASSTRNIFLLILICGSVLCYSFPQNENTVEMSNRNDVTAIYVDQPVIPVLVGNEFNVILHMIISMDTSSVFSQIELSTIGTTSLSDIEGVRVYFTASLDGFLTTDAFGAEMKPEENLIFSDNKSLKTGDNHVWVSYQLKGTANINNLVSGTIKSVVIDDTLTKIDIETKPKRLGLALRQRNQDGVNAYRIPGLATTNEGTLIAVYDARYNSSVDLQEDIDIGMSRSSDGGQSWEVMKVVMDMGEWGGKDQDVNGVGDPSILVDRQTGTIWVAALWFHGHTGERAWFASGSGITPEETGQLLLVKSDDDGLTWSDPINITSQIKDPKWQLLLYGPGKGISIKDGTLVFPAQFKDQNKVPFSTLISSKDHGKTWQIGTGVTSETTEAQIVELNDGSIMINCRNNRAGGKVGVGRVVAVTNDLGQTWQTHPSSLVALEESTCMASLIYESFEGYGNIMLFSNPNTHAGRFNMTIKSSKDEGQTWPNGNWLLLDEGKSWGYSCMTKINEEFIGILYEGSNANLTFQKIKISDLVY